MRKFQQTRRMDQQKAKTQNKNEDNEEVRGDPSRDLPEWLVQFLDNLVDESVPEHRDASSSSHEITFRAASKSGIW